MKIDEIREVKDGYLILPKEFRYKGFKFKQIKRVKNKAIYKIECGKINSFEVVKITRHEGYEIAGNKFPPAEVYPNSESWGINGWTYTTERDAEEKFNKI